LVAAANYLVAIDQFPRLWLDLPVDLRVYPEKVSTRLKIKQVVDESGFSAATLRYYEQIGLLPVAQRSASGYRLYDHLTLRRLTFIARAKQLGFSLNEIAGMASTWDGERCGPIQSRMRAIVAEKILTVEDQINQLMSFTAELKRASNSLSDNRSDVLCDGDCGCVSSHEGLALHPTVARIEAPSATVDIACSLTGQSIDDRIGEWKALLAYVAERESIDGGIRCKFRPNVPIAELMRLVTAEQSCCQFFCFSVTVDRSGIGLEVRAPEDAHSITTLIFGLDAEPMS
jgi:MerR family transcriptional regulator, copper efflux regulator